MPETVNGANGALVLSSDFKTPPASPFAALAGMRAGDGNRKKGNVMPTKLTPVTPAATVAATPAPKTDLAGTLAAVRARRMAALAMKVEIDPMLTENIAALNQERDAIVEIRQEAADNLSILQASLGDKEIPQDKLKRDIKQQRELLGQMETALNEIDAALVGVNQEGGVGVTLALIARLRVKRSVEELLREFEAGPMHASAITKLVDDGLNSGWVKLGHNEPFFRWSANLYTSAIAGDGEALGFIPRVSGYISALDETKLKRRNEVAQWLLDGPELTAFVKGHNRTSLSALLQGAEGFVLVPVQGIRDTMGNLVVQREPGQKTVGITHTTGNPLLVEWAMQNSKKAIARRALRQKEDLTFDHPHKNIRSALDTQWTAEEPLRNFWGAVKARDAELAKLGGEKAQALTVESAVKVFKPTTAGAGLWTVPITWFSEGKGKGDSIPCGIVFEKKGGKLKVVSTTESCPDALKGESSGPYKPDELPTMLRAALYFTCKSMGVEIPVLEQAPKPKGKGGPQGSPATPNGASYFRSFLPPPKLAYLASHRATPTDHVSAGGFFMLYTQYICAFLRSSAQTLAFYKVV